jgi:hypothetical protein
MAKSSGKHALRDTPHAPAQLPVAMRSLLEREQDHGGPSADKNRYRRFRFVHLPRCHCLACPCLLVIAHKLNLARDWQGVGVTSVAGFRWIR